MPLKKELSSMALLAEVRELQELVDAKVEKIYQPARGELSIRLNHRTFKRKYLVIATGDRKLLFADEEKKDMPQDPGMFAMLLRKYLEGSRITALRQHDFDRIVEIEFSGKFDGEDASYTLIAELFSKGNLILLDGEKTIIQPLTAARWRDRAIVPKERYAFPPSKTNPLLFSRADFERILAASDKNLVKALALDVNVGGAVAEELCFAAGVDKTLKASAAGADTVEKLYGRYDAIRTAIMETRLEPAIVRNGEAVVDVVPVAFERYATLQQTPTATLSEALKQFYEATEVAAPSESSQRVRDLQAQLGRQEASVREFEDAAETERAAGDALYAHFTELEQLLRDVTALRDREGWGGIATLVGTQRGGVTVTGIQAKRGVVAVALDGYADSELDIRQSITENANAHYEKSKKMKSKITGAGAAIEETRKKIAAAEKAAVNEKNGVGQTARRSKPFWFEDFRWFITSDGHIVAAGRDAHSNDRVVKKHLKKSDRYAHATIHGAPSVVVKNKSGAVSDTALDEARIFAAAYSKAWSLRLGAGEAYWVEPDQVSKRPEAGEFVGRGAFIIRGEKRMKKDIPLELGIGPITYEGKTLLMCGPLDAVKSQTKTYVVIRPGSEKKEVLARELKQLFGVSADTVIKVLPPGESAIVERHVPRDQ